MPTYQYACTACGHKFEAVQSFSDASLTDCPECAGRLRKVFSSVGIVFKGSGFYRTDSRAAESSGDVKVEKSEKSEKSDKKPADAGSSGGDGGGSAKQGAGEVGLRNQERRARRARQQHPGRRGVLTSRARRAARHPPGVVPVAPPRLSTSPRGCPQVRPRPAAGRGRLLASSPSTTGGADGPHEAHAARGAAARAARRDPARLGLAAGRPAAPRRRGPARRARAGPGPDPA